MKEVMMNFYGTNENHQDIIINSKIHQKNKNEKFQSKYSHPIPKQNNKNPKNVIHTIHTQLTFNSFICSFKIISFKKKKYAHLHLGH